HSITSLSLSFPFVSSVMRFSTALRTASRDLYLHSSQPLFMFSSMVGSRSFLCLLSSRVLWPFHLFWGLEVLSLFFLFSRIHIIIIIIIMAVGYGFYTRTSATQPPFLLRIFLLLPFF